MKKTIKSLLCAVALTGMGSSASAQGNFDRLPDYYKNLTPWDSASVCERKSGIWTLENGEYIDGGYYYDPYSIIRKPEENKVSLIDNSRADKRTVYTWEYSVDRKLKSKLNEDFWLNDSTGVFELWNKELYTYDENGKMESSAKFGLNFLTGNLELTSKTLNTYDENGKLQAVINNEGGVQDTTEKYENGKLIYKRGFVKTERNDTTVFSGQGDGYRMVYEYDSRGNEIFYKLSYEGYEYQRRTTYSEAGFRLGIEIEYKNESEDEYEGEKYYNFTHTLTDSTFNEAGHVLAVKETRFAKDSSVEFVEYKDCTYNNDLGLLTKCKVKKVRPSENDSSLTEINYTYNEAGLLIRVIHKDWDFERNAFNYYNSEVYNYEYNSKNQLIRESHYIHGSDNSTIDYAYDHNGNLTIEFSFEDSEGHYAGWYLFYEYEGGKKKEYAPFDPAMYPTDSYPANSPVAKHGKLQVSGKNMVDVNGNIVQLRGISTHGISWFPQCYNESSVDALVDDWGINVLRIASYAENQVANKDWEWRKEFIDTLVNVCEKKGIYCIIDWHILRQGTGDPWFLIDEAKEFFEYMSKKYAGKAHVMYEICNEPNTQDNAVYSSWARIKSYAQEIIDVIVQNDPSSIIIVGTPEWSQRVLPAAYSPLDYPNAMYALHFYAASSWHKDELREKATMAVEKNLPIFVSEFGTCGDGGSGSLDVPETIKWFKWMNDNNLSWVNWNFADKAESSCLLKPNSCEEQNWDNYTESGRIIKWALSDPELNGADSVLLVDAALKKNKYLRIKDIRFDYLGSCIAENPSFVTDNDIDGLVHCAYIKECLAEEPELAKDEARLDSCAKDKATDVALTNSSLHGVSVYPNPVKDNLVVDYDGGVFSVVLIDLLGSEVLREECVQGKNVVNVSSLAPGCYLVKVESNGKFHFEKMSKE
ncbi:MAG: cellulase family glycosylhydrolase [Paludibacteraceae bacterium]|nr:cellulase family glycosylhydrolase [Paludibacteraceae bacterium]